MSNNKKTAVKADFVLRCGRGSNPRMAVLQTAALPLRHHTSKP